MQVLSEIKTYTTISPTIIGVLSDDYLYFEGVKKPSTLFMIKEKIFDAHDVVLLERYWNDVYNLFLRKLTLFSQHTPSTDEDSLKLQALLQELIKVKQLIENAPKMAIMRT